MNTLYVLSKCLKTESELFGWLDFIWVDREIIKDYFRRRRYQEERYAVALECKAEVDSWSKEKRYLAFARDP